MARAFYRSYVHGERRAGQVRRVHIIREDGKWAGRQSDVDPERNDTFIASLSPTDQRDLLIVLAAMVDPSVPLPVALGWTDALVVADG